MENIPENKKQEEKQASEKKKEHDIGSGSIKESDEGSSYKIQEQQMGEENKKASEAVIPVLKDDEHTLTSRDEKELFSVQRFLDAKISEGSGRKLKKEQKRKEQNEETLEESLGEGNIAVEKQEQDAQAVEAASLRPVSEFYNEMAGIYRAAEEKGYLTRGQMQRVQYINAVVEQKEQATYTPTQEAAGQISMIQQLKERLQGMYRKSSEKAEKIRHGYRSNEDENYQTLVL